MIADMDEYRGQESIDDEIVVHQKKTTYSDGLSWNENTIE